AGGRVRWFRRRIGLLVILKHTSNLTEQAFFLLAWLRALVSLRVCSCTACGTRRRLRLLISQAQNFRQNAVYAITLVAGVGRFRADDEGRSVSLRAGRGGKQVGKFIKLHIYDPGRLAERLHFGIVREA